ncbi:MAG TPA: trigger factor [Tepidisphaeraceae bacterium]|jgi:trigger factor|nr:trigger factor [Tepidisphaeraceae bacterium]
MAEENTAVAEQETDAYEYAIKVEDAGPATKKVSVEIPRERIDTKLAEQYKELRTQAAIPGFRPGRAPAKLIEKKFASDVKDQVRRTLISESYQQAIEKNNLQVLGEPEIEDAEKLEITDGNGLNYTFSVEVQPEITLPELKGIKVKKPKIEIKDENVEQAMTNLREQQGALVPVEDRGVQAKDYVTADVHVKVGDEVIDHGHDSQIVVRPGRIAGIQIADLDKQLEGTKAGETKTITVTAPDTHPNEKIKGKEVAIEVMVKDIKKLEAAEINQEFLEGLGFENEQELRDALREQMVERINFDVQQSQREQVSKYLSENVNFELPAKLSDKQADRVVQRRAMDLMQRGVPQEKIIENIEQLRGGAKDEAARELKLFFILQKIATDQNVDVDEAELNGRIAMLAAQRGERPEKMKQQMSKDGSLSNLYVTMREQKAIDTILATAEIEEVEVGKEEEAAKAE